MTLDDYVGSGIPKLNIVKSEQLFNQCLLMPLWVNAGSDIAVIKRFMSRHAKVLDPLTRKPRLSVDPSAILSFRRSVRDHVLGIMYMNGFVWEEVQEQKLHLFVHQQDAETHGYGTPDA